ncbi:hypothetical protein F4859DRAFT_510495 [Xylaria cf. heliscus]|nr:hypothetical protein F4859DRAFT_510495 [Xylaria cf. heliscus]
MVDPQAGRDLFRDFYGQEDAASEVRSASMRARKCSPGKRLPSPLSRGIRLQTVLDVASGLNHIHKMYVQHCDLTYRNLFLFDNFLVEIGEFGGSLIKEHKPLKPIVYEESAHELPCRGREFEKRPARGGEPFALGSAIYEIMAWRQPFEGWTDDDIEKTYAAEVFPDLEKNRARHIIRKC